MKTVKVEIDLGSLQDAVVRRMTHLVLQGCSPAAAHQFVLIESITEDAVVGEPEPALFLVRQMTADRFTVLCDGLGLEFGTVDAEHFSKVIGETVEEYNNGGAE